MRAAARLHVNGTALDWHGVLADTGGRVVDLPTYPFERARYWPEPPAPAANSLRYRTVRTPGADDSGAVLTGRWLVLATADDPLADAVAEGLARNGAQVSRSEDVAATGEAESVVSMLDLQGTLAAVQALGDTRLWCVTRGAEADPGAAGVWGLGRVAALERPDRWGGLVDLPDRVDNRAIDRLCGVLAGSTEDQVTVRDSGVFVRRLVPAPETVGDPWRPAGTVLVTGGTGALGTHTARWLVAEGAERVILLSRRGPTAPGADELRAELGDRVVIVACDVTDRDALAHVVDEYPPNAVVHAAGIVDDGVLETLTPQRVSAVVAAKVTSARLLDELTADRDLDAFVVFSSIAGTLGAAGQGGYAAANAMLDAVVKGRRSRGLRATSVAWGPWAGPGMAAQSVVAGKLRRQGLRPLAPDVALAALAAAVGNDDTAVVVAGIDWSRFAPGFAAARPTHLFDELPDAMRALGAVQARTVGAPTVSLADLPVAERERAALMMVREQVAAVLGHRDTATVEPGRAFRDLGFDSLTGIELRNLVSAATGLSLPSTLVFDYTNPAALAAHLATAVGGRSGGDEPVLAEFDRLAATLTALPASELTATRITARLQALVAELTERLSGSGGQTVTDKLRSATSDELFDFIDNELGVS
jgi:NAD(P)-dependent dehydrogenase (short-subunit alcohol dehydrogenase family)/acyl carrier protein